MSEKIFRDPLYNYISIDREKDGWLLELLDCCEVQRLRRIHQLGVSHFTYPGADHSRLSHTLGVVHLMQIAWDHIARSHFITDPQVERARHILLAAALLHDVGHGPFSHVFEPCLGINHEEWSCQIIESPESEVNAILRRYDIPPEDVTSLIRENDYRRPAWQKSLLSSQLDVDRLDYLRRDSLFTGSGYGHFDWYRLLHTFTVHGPADGYRDLVWSEKAKYSIEEYVFSRFYMYENVYFHRTTRGFEKMLQAMWARAKALKEDGTAVALVKPIGDFWNAANPTPRQYLALEEFTVLMQMQNWCSHADRVLSDLASRFLNRKHFVAIDAPSRPGAVPLGLADWEEQLQKLVVSNGFEPAKSYMLRDDLADKLYNVKTRRDGPYVPEPESLLQVPRNAIRIVPEVGAEPVEITELLHRLSAVTREPTSRVRYYVPEELRNAALKMRKEWEAQKAVPLKSRRKKKGR